MADTISVPEYIRAMDESFNIRTSGMSSDALEDNMIDHYIEHLFDLCEILESFTDVEKAQWNKDPKRMSYDLWGTTDYFFVIMIMNDLDHYEDMDMYKIDKLYVPGPSRLSFLRKLVDRKINDNLIPMDYE